jgi:hypothetical protein
MNSEDMIIVCDELDKINQREVKGYSCQKKRECIRERQKSLIKTLTRIQEYGTNHPDFPKVCGFYEKLRNASEGFAFPSFLEYCDRRYRKIVGNESDKEIEQAYRGIMKEYMQEAIMAINKPDKKRSLKIMIEHRDNFCDKFADHSKMIEYFSKLIINGYNALYEPLVLRRRKNEFEK